MRTLAKFLLMTVILACIAGIPTSLIFTYIGIFIALCIIESLPTKDEEQVSDFIRGEPDKREE